jgi:hypothetical protein
MALRWMDSFDRYGTPQLAARYPSGAGGAMILVAGGRRPPSGALVPEAAQDVRIALTGTAALISGCAVWASAVTADTPLMRVRRGGLIQATLGRTPAGAVVVARGDLTGPRLGTSTDGVLAPNTYATVAWEILPDPSAGRALVVVNGTTVLAIASGNTAGATLPGYDDLGLCGDAAGAQRFDDWYVLDMTGAPPNARLPEDVRVDAVPPISQGVHGSWTPSLDTRWQCVDDEGVPNDDADYTATTIPGLMDSFTPPGAPLPGATVYGAQVSVVARRLTTAPAPVTLAPLLRSLGVDAVGSAVPVPATATYGYVTAPFAPPDVTQGQAWLSTLEFGYRRT